MITKAVPLAHQYIPNLLKVTLIKSSSKCNPGVRSCLEALGMSKINKHRYHKNTPEIRGMIFKVGLFPLLVLYINTVITLIFSFFFFPIGC